MRIVLTIIALALVVALSVALVAPFLIDWSAHRDEIAARLGALAGADVKLEGPVTLRLLPTPYLEVGAGSAVVKGPGGPRLSFESARIELALVKLVSGAIRFTEVDLDKPVLTLTRSPDGALSLPALPGAEADTLGFDRLVVRDGRLMIEGAGSPRAFDDIELTADAPSLSGPVHVTGQFGVPNGPSVAFRLATEKAGPSGAPARLSIDAGPGWPALEFDGAASAAGAHGANLSGAAKLIGAAPGPDGPTPWRVVGPMTADLDRATLSGAEFRFGSEERAVRADGEASLAYATAPRLVVRAKAKQANLDALYRRKGEDGVPPTRALAAIVAALAPSTENAGALAIEASLAADAVVLGSDTISNFSAALKTAPGARPHARFDVGLPGQTRFMADGDWEAGPAARFAGSVDFMSADPAALNAWASQGAPDWAAKAAGVVKAIPSREFSIKGGVEVSAVDLSGRGLAIGLDRSKLTGSATYTSPVGAKPGRLTLDLASDSLDIDEAPDVRETASSLSDLDLSVALDAKALRVARVGEAPVESGSLALKLVKSGESVTLERLAVADLGGASMAATGTMGPGGVSANGHLHADRLRDFAALVERLAPGDWAHALVERANLLSPADVAFEAHGPWTGSDGPKLDSAKANGTVGGTQASFGLAPGPKDGHDAITLSLDSADASVLLRQLGLKGATSATGPGHIALTASGSADTGFDADGTASLFGAELSGRGRFVPLAEGDAARLFGAFKAKAANLSPLAAALGWAPAGGAIGPADVAADVTLRGRRWTVTRLLGTVAGVKASGNLAYEPARPNETAPFASPDVSRAEEAVSGPAIAQEPASQPEVTGDLAFDRLALGELTALALGAPAAPKPGALWSDAKFGAAPVTPPPTAVHVNIGALDLGNGLAAQPFAAALRLEKGRLDLDDIQTTIAGGTVSGHATLHRDKDTATLAGALSAEGVSIRRPGASAHVGGSLDFASTGPSQAALIAGLAGDGAARFSGAEIAGLDPEALARVVASAQEADAQVDQTNVAYRFGNELDRKPLDLPDGETPIALSAGALKAGPLAIPLARGGATLTGTLDLRNLTLETELALTLPPTGLKFWTGPAPSASVTIEDLLGAHARELDVGALSAGLATQAIGRESDRIANFEADIRERAFFNRRLKGERFIDRRNAEIEDWRAEQERHKGLAQHLEEQRAEEAKLAAEKAAAEKAAAEKAAAEKAAAERAAAAKEAREKALAEPELPPDVPAAGDVVKPDELGAASNAPLPPSRPRRKPAPAPTTKDPAASGIY